MNFSTFRMTLFVAAVVSLTAMQSVRAALFADFEQPVYPAASPSGTVSIIGVDGWVNLTGTAGLTPDPGGSGYTTVILGSQSAWDSGYNERQWGSTAPFVSNQTVISALMNGPDSDSHTGAIYFSENMSDTPGGIEAAGNHFNIFAPAGGNSGVAFVQNHVYLLTMIIDIPTWQFTPSIQDLTAGSPAVNLGPYAMYPVGNETLANAKTNGGLILGGTAVWDDLQVSTLPEPASLALLGLGGLTLLRRKKN